MTCFEVGHRGANGKGDCVSAEHGSADGKPMARRLDSDLLRQCAAMGRFPATGLRGASTHDQFESRPYRIRAATERDLDRLAEIERRCWPAALRCEPGEIRNRLNRGANDCIALEVDREVVGAIYAQKVRDLFDLDGTTAGSIGRLHDPAGQILLLLGACVLPEQGALGLGDILLDFILLDARLRPDVESVAGITLCYDYRPDAHGSFADYVDARDESGMPRDPVLRFHAARGARIGRLLPGYRPGHIGSAEHGVLVTYGFADQGEQDASVVAASRGVILDVLEGAVRDLLGPARAAAYRPAAALRDLGLTSLQLHALRDQLSRRLSLPVEPDFFFRHPTVERIADALTGHTPSPGRARAPRKLTAPPVAPARQPGQAEPVALVGMACRFPGGVSDPAAYWQALLQGRNLVGGVPAGRWPEPPGGGPERFGGFLDDVAGFDAGFFGMSPREAAATDPQQRLMLELAWEGLEDAAIAPDTLAGSDTGVFVGLCSHDFEHLSVRQGRPGAIDGYFGTGNAASIVAGRIAYTFDLRGPALTIDTACSSALVAVDQACRALQEGRCGVALVGAVNLILSPETSLAFSQAGMLAADGRCKVFDAAADGYVRSEGAALIVLKRLSDAHAANDRIYAVIRGSAVNQDGASNGLTAPNGAAQEAVMRQALVSAGIEAGQVGYIETHGTGTALGDPIEVAAIDAVYCAARRAQEPLPIGSAKAVLGHTEAAAGLAGLLKAVLVLRHGVIPPQPHFTSPNPLLNLEARRLHVPIRPEHWSQQGDRMAAISSFGFAGTNAHAIVSAAPGDPRTEDDPDFLPDILVLSARTPAALDRTLRNHAERIAADPDLSLHDLCRTAAGRRHFEHRAAVLVSDRAEAAARLAAPVSTCWRRGSARQPPKIAFLFTGQGVQRTHMGRSLYETQPVYRAAFDRCAALLARHQELSLGDIVFPEHTDSKLITRMTLAQPALFAVEYALAELWASWGVKPDMVIGHSLGECVAACVAGMLSLEDALALVAARGRLMESLTPSGAMAAVAAPPDDVAPVLNGLPAPPVIAAFNGPDSTVISGGPESVEAASTALEAAGLEVRLLDISRASHSPLMEPMLAPFLEVCRGLDWRLPAIPIVSNLTGLPASREMADPAYWPRQIRQPVRFSDGVRALAHAGCTVFLELGPKPVLSGLGPQCLDDEGDACGRDWLFSLTPELDDNVGLAQAAQQLYVLGANIDWAGFRAARPGRPVSLPTTPFERRRHWLPDPRPAQDSRIEENASLLGERLSLAVEQTVWTSTVTLERFSYLEGHRLAGAPLLPGAAALALMMSAADRASQLENIAFTEPLWLLPITTLQLTFTPDDQHFRLFAKVEEGWSHHVCARLKAAPQNGGERFDSEALVARLAPAEPAALRAAFQGDGLSFGPAFEGLQKLWLGDSETLGWIAPTGAGVVDMHAYPLHPTMLDAALQVVRGIVAEPGLLWRIESLTFWRRATGAGLWAYARACGGNGADLDLFEADGSCIASLRGCVFKRLPASIPSWKLAWEERPSRSGAESGGRFLVFADRGGVADALSVALGKAGHGCRLIKDCPPDEVDGMLLRAAENDLSGVVDLRALDICESPIDADHHVCATALPLMQSAIRAIPRVRALTLVTRGVHGGGALAQSLLWGLALVGAREHPELTPRLIDLDPDEDVMAAGGRLANEILAADAREEPRVRLYGGRQVHRLAPAQVSEQRPLIRADGIHLVTGGMGALGFHVARWLVAQGAKHLMLLGRSQPSPEAMTQIERWRRAGVQVSIAAGDVADEGFIRRLLEDLDHNRSVLRSVFHCAGVVSDALLADLDPAELSAALSPKVAGGWVMHRLTQDRPLDHFVLFSSAFSLVGAPGLAGYAAGNVFLNALAAHRRHHGLPALSVGWGPWEGDGMVQAGRRARVAEWTRQGIGLMSPDSALSALGRAMGSSEPCIGLFSVDWQTFARAFGQSLPRTFELVALPAGETAQRSNMLAEQLAALPSRRRRAVLADHVAALAAQALGFLDGSEIDRDQGFFALGMESITLMAFHRSLQTAFGRRLNRTVLFRYATVNELTDHLLRGLDGEASARPSETN